MTVKVATRKFTVDEYYKMAEAGILNEDDGVELIEGEIVEMPPIGDRHRLSVDRINYLFAAQLTPLNVFVSVQQPLPLDRQSQPQPDLILVRGKPEDYQKHPGVQDALLVIEVGDSTAAFDRERKLPLYAAAHVPEVWLVDLVTNTVEVCRRPTATGYEERRTVQPDESLSPEALPGLRIQAAAIIP